MKIKYFDHAATTYVDKDVLNEIIPYYTNNFGNPSAKYSLGFTAKDAITSARKKVADTIGAKSNEIYFTSCGSESDNLAIKGIARANKLRGRHIITSKIEHPAVLNTCATLEKEGFNITYLNTNSKGRISIHDLEKAIRKDTILVSIMFANNEIGTIQPIYDIGNLCKKHHIYFHTDAVQAVGNIPINVNELNIDALSMSGHKFYAPKGIGALYIRNGVRFIRIQDGGHQESDKRSGTENVPGIVGIGKALEIANSNLKSNNEYLKYLRDYYEKNVLDKLDRIKINGDIENRLCTNSNIIFEGVDGKKLLEILDKRGICASSGSACSAGLLTPSHVLLAIGVDNMAAKGSLRVSFGKENTIEDVDYLVNVLVEAVTSLRRHYF